MGKVQKPLVYKGFKVEQDNSSGWIARRRGQLVAGGDTLREVKHVLDEMIKQKVNHESELK